MSVTSPTAVILLSLAVALAPVSSAELSEPQAFNSNLQDLVKLTFTS